MKFWLEKEAAPKKIEINHTGLVVLGNNHQNKCMRKGGGPLLMFSC